ncbi:ribonuclease H family protein [Flagellimonas marinaquae]|nr:ribonuclease H family protein [uncultured Allomuricauda sp.]MAO18973.1 ribonuclease H [Allomuricauda sp.]MBC71680.1 ribonuclease H [Allomuricauda sp.]UBZ15637.1 ribonuclease H family protein [Allomuricauda aquimarina]|tara:strand:- start:249 stop:884 length:636 start_codon:yes stop_codon:yes gene_type:complete
MAKKKKFYVVWQGKHPGIFESWKDCKAQIEGYKGAQYKSFATFEEAKKAYNGNYQDYKGKSKGKSELSPEELLKIGDPNYNSIAVDAASSGNPGRMEYRGVDTKTKKVLFHQGPFEQGTSNVGEFLALVHGLAFLQQKKSERILYSDSRIAIGWVRKKKCGTKLVKNAKNAQLFELIERAENWLKKNRFNTPIVKWETKAWGEIPADFGRK